MASDHEHPATPYEPVSWREGHFRLLDQTRLPFEEVELELRSVDAVAEAIRAMRVRGAPAIGVTAAYGMALASREGREALERAAETLASTRPTAVNLGWAIERMLAATRRPGNDPAAMLAEARAIHEEQRAADRAMAEAGAALIPPGSTVLTHCNTGPLATAGLGTALGVIIEAHRRGRVARVLVDETRPRLQGARLTAWELQQHGVPFDVIADGAAASLLVSGEVQAALVGADRIAANGDTANKIGTLGVALAAEYAGVPFIVVAPRSTIDPATPSGAAIPIEERDATEVLEADGHELAAPGASARNPAFDITPAALITALVTERGVLRPPFGEAIAALFARQEALP